MSEEVGSVLELHIAGVELLLPSQRSSGRKHLDQRTEWRPRDQAVLPSECALSRRLMDLNSQSLASGRALESRRTFRKRSLVGGSGVKWVGLEVF